MFRCSCPYKVVIRCVHLNVLVVVEVPFVTVSQGVVSAVRNDIVAFISVSNRIPGACRTRHREPAYIHVIRSHLKDMVVCI